MSDDRAATPLTPQRFEVPRPAMVVWNVALVVAPIVTIVYSFIAWFRGVRLAGFWADDFLHLVQLGPMSSIANLFVPKYSVGRFPAALYWAVVSRIWRGASAEPYLIVNTAVIWLGVAAWLWTGSRRRWPWQASFWIAAFVFANAAWLPMALWTSNIVHSAAVALLGLGMVCFDRCQEATRLKMAVVWAVLSSLAWFFLTMSNPLYMGVLALAAYAGWSQRSQLRRLGASRLLALLPFSLSIAPALIYFVVVAYPQTHALGVYQGGLKQIRPNISYYTYQMVRTGSAQVIYGGMFLVAVVLAAVVLWRRRNAFPAACLVSAVVVSLVVLTQAYQRSDHYWVMPMILVASALAAGLTDVARARRVRPALRVWGVLAGVGVGTLALISLYGFGIFLRAYFVTTPTGAQLVVFRDQVHALDPEDSPICVVEELPQSDVAFFAGEVAGPASSPRHSAFVLPPISARSVSIVSAAAQCPSLISVRIAVRMSAGFALLPPERLPR